MDQDNQPITVFGGTGHYGRVIVNDLLERGVPVRVFTRNAGRARKILGERPLFIEDDITSCKSTRMAIQGARAIVIAVSAMHWKTIRRIRQIERDAILIVLKAARHLGVSRIVYLSGYEIRKGVLEELGFPQLGDIQLEIESELADSHFNWTVLGCAPSMELFYSFIHKNKMIVPGGGPPGLPTIARADVGAIASEAVLRADLGGRRFRLTGPEAMSFPEAARRVGKITGRNISFRKLPLFVFGTASFLLLPINPFLRYIYWYLQLLHHFPQDLVDAVPEDHRRLVETFDYSPKTFEMETKERYT